MGEQASFDPILTTAAALGRLRVARPRVHVLTNPVAMAISANALLALGAVPSMTFRADSMADFLAGSAALVVNLGMLEPEREAAARRAAPLARELGRPWVLDPVKVDRDRARSRLAAGLLEHGPAVVRANPAEIAALAGDLPAAEAAARLALAHGTVVAMTGAVDLVTDGTRALRIANGSPLMDLVTAMGCTASAVVGAFLAVEPEPFAACVAALLAFAVAGEIAAGRAGGPGTFQPLLLDALHALDEPTLRARARLA
jgi:hydroxyethylthiazole kinase